MEGVITRAFVISTGANSYVGRYDDDAKLISANIYASKSAAARDIGKTYQSTIDGGCIIKMCDRIVAINIEIAKREV